MTHKKSYKKKFIAHLSNTSSYGSVYYVTYHHWAAMTKEQFFLETVPGFSNLFFKDGIRLAVLESNLKIHQPLALHDRVEVDLICAKLTPVRAELRYSIIRNGIVTAEAFNKIVFTNSGYKLIKMPLSIFKALESILV